MLAGPRPLHRPGGTSMRLFTRGWAPALVAVAGALAALACATGTGRAPRAAGAGDDAAVSTRPGGDAASDPASPPSPYPSTYSRQPSSPVLVAHATVLTAAGQRLESASVLLRDGKIAAVG